MKYCIECGSEKVALEIPEGDNRERFVCQACSYIHYQNPRMICGTIPVFEDKILLCRRAIEPRKGYWTLPAGFMENGETIEEASVRETYEEALAVSVKPQLYSIFSLPHINQVHIFYKCDIKDGKFGAGTETLESALFSLDEIPWDELSFRTVIQCIKHYIEDVKTGVFPVRSESLLLPPQELEKHK